MKLLKEKLLALNIFTDNDYLDCYCNLIIANKNTSKECGNKTNVHHIIPKCYYRHHNLQIDNSKDNVVNLLFKDHILARYYLTLCSKDSWFKHANETALFLFMKNKLVNDTAILDETEFIKSLDKYQDIYDDYAQNLSQRNSGKNNGRFGKEVSRETRDKISLANKGKPSYWKGKHISAETRKKISESHKGKATHKPGTFHLSKEARLKISEKNKGRKQSEEEKLKRAITLHRVKVYCIELDMVFDSIKAAEDYINTVLNIKSSSICKCCRGERQTSGGFHWKYFTE